jgi:agmatine deiminase
LQGVGVASEKLGKAKVLKGLPGKVGYVFPAEWAPHKGTWLSWPRPEGISFPDKYHTVPENLVRIIREIAAREQVHINVPNENYRHIVRGFLKEFGCGEKNVFFHFIPTNEAWCRDHGPAFLNYAGTGKKKPQTVIDWGFNAWGGKYPPYDSDDSVPTKVAGELGLGVFNPGIIMEGGSVDFNGAGTVLTTTQCLLNKNRNPALSKAEIEQYLKDYYGQKHVCWLGEGIVGDDTDGHIDDLARFVDGRTIVTTVEEDPKDANYEILTDNLRRCKKLRDQDGRAFDVVTLPMPGVVEHDGQRLPATYANFYFVNGAVLVPTYRHKKNDKIALQTLQRLMPKRQVVGVDCWELIWGLGAIHCLTQQWPKA